MTLKNKKRGQRWTYLLKSLLRNVAPHPLRSEKGIGPPPFFIVSGARSGSTLLRAMLIQDPTVHIPPEFKLLDANTQEFMATTRYLPWGHTVRLFGATIAAGTTLPRWEMTLADFYERAANLPRGQRSLAALFHTFYMSHAQTAKPEATRWGDKSPINVRWLAEIGSLFPQAKVIFIARDGRDVVASIHKLGWFESLAQTCDVWLDSMQALLATPQWGDESKLMAVRYEQLVKEPESVLRSVCDFLDLTFDPGMLAFHERPERVGYEAGMASHAGLHKPVYTGAVGSWRRRLDEQQQAYVTERLGPMNTRLGYGLA